MRKGEFDKAREKFATAREQFDSGDAGKAAIAAFDLACASHRKGDVAQAREWYLKAGLAHDKGLAASAHFNLGTLAAEEARRLAGEHPENVAPEKRQEILDQLKEIPDVGYGLAYQNLLNAANERLNRPLKNGYRMEGKLTAAKLDRIELLADGVSIVLHLNGDLKIFYGI